jgi:hypothetical protein
MSPGAGVVHCSCPAVLLQLSPSAVVVHWNPPTRCCWALYSSCSTVAVRYEYPAALCGALELSPALLWCAMPAVPAALCAGTPAAAPVSCTPGYPAARLLHSGLPCSARTFPRISPATAVLRQNGRHHRHQRAEAVVLSPGCKNDAQSVSLFGGRESIFFFSHTKSRAASRVQAHEPGGPCGPAFAARRAYERGATRRRVRQRAALQVVCFGTADGGNRQLYRQNSGCPSLSVP